jgi:hypothetical protein
VVLRIRFVHTQVFPAVFFRRIPAAVHDTAHCGKIAFFKFCNMVAYAVTRPIISCPGTIGYMAPPNSFLAWCRSEWQIPQYKIFNSTSCGNTSRRGMFISFSGDSAAAVPKAFTFFVVIIVLPFILI